MKAIDWKNERKINPGFFDEFKKRWILFTENPRCLRLQQFDFKSTAHACAKNAGLEPSEYTLHRRKTLPSITDTLMPEQSNA